MKRIRKLLNPYLTSAYEQELFEAVYNNLIDKANKLRFNNFSYSAREFLGHLIAKIGPEDNIRECQWFAELSPKSRKKVLRSQKVKYAIQGGLTDEFIVQYLEIDIAEINNKIQRILDILNSHTHIRENTFNIPEDEVDEKVRIYNATLTDLFNTIEQSKEQIIDTFLEAIEESLIDKLIGEGVEALEELSTHHSLDSHYIEDIKITEIDATYIYLVVEGSIDVVLQYGSNSDLRNGDGLEMEENYPFTVTLKGEVNQITDFSVELDTFSLNTGSFHG